VVEVVEGRPCVLRIIIIGEVGRCVVEGKPGVVETVVVVGFVVTRGIFVVVVDFIVLLFCCAWVEDGLVVVVVDVIGVVVVDGIGVVVVDGTGVVVVVVAIATVFGSDGQLPQH